MATSIPHLIRPLHRYQGGQTHQVPSLSGEGDKESCVVGEQAESSERDSVAASFLLRVDEGLCKSVDGLRFLLGILFPVDILLGD